MPQDVPVDKLVVVKHNDLIDAAHRLSIYESRILLSCIAKINSKEVLDPSLKFTLTVENIADLVGLEKNNAYAELREASDRLYQREIIFLQPSKRVSERRVRWVSQIDYIPNEGTIELFFTPSIVKLLSEITRDFTQYKLENVLKFKSSYSVRLYELLCRWGGKNKQVDIDWLRECLQIEDKYSRWDHFKDWVIEPAIRDINKFSNLNVTWTSVKQGRKITSIKFNYGFNKEVRTKTKLDAVKFETQKKSSEVIDIVKQSSLNNKVNKPKKSKFYSEKNDNIDNIEYFANMRKRYGDAAKGIPVDIIELLKSQGRW
jgi:plasmid replication initiation protein